MNLFGWIIAIDALLALAIGLAADESGRNGFAWFFIVLLTGIIGTLFYVATSPSEKKKELEQRVTELESEAEYCPQCGIEITQSGCPDCGYGSQPPTREDGYGEIYTLPFTKSLGYAVVGILAFFVALATWYEIASILVPLDTLTPNQATTDLHRHIKDIGTIHGLSLSLFGFYTIRVIWNHFTITDTERKANAALQLLLLAHASWKTIIVFDLSQTIAQAMITVGMVLTIALLTAACLHNAGIWPHPRQLTKHTT